MARAPGTRRVSPTFKGGSLAAFQPARASSGAGVGYDLRKGMAVQSVTCITASTAFRGSLQGSADGLVWRDIKTGLTGSAAGVTVASTQATTPIQFVRGRVTTATTNVGVTVQMQITLAP